MDILANLETTKTGRILKENLGGVALTRKNVISDTLFPAHCGDILRIIITTIISTLQQHFYVKYI